ncbi:tripartite tricarboxylate transporter TctB family protein [Meiothermus sp. CFH 77666]|uniref:tripartite tricarboxylate transporter TctB family protein n=1 Tax=Meiothermus sp. CFH 77666 TaxID=2817942 RepID=UPI001AA05496|nr:tripartite tricarboxylate transporter TctB family protein [Meiothermus sp. CFH 77666]MBO1436821.1 tripartite tricarboxylate transporter TctB family protein [Meiothermus sp. CFH 77666]
MTDRIVGALVLLLALGYAIEASRMQVGFLSDPLGPRPFPYIIAVLVGISALWLLFRPDPEPDWPPRRFWPVLGLVLLSLVAYAYLIVPLGFIVTTTLEMTLLAVLFGARWWQGLGGALAFTLAVYLLFTQGLGVTLPVGRIFG